MRVLGPNQPSPIGGEFQVNTCTTSLHSRPPVAADQTGYAVVVWTSWSSSGTDTHESRIQGQRLEFPIFTDGFESGDTSMWN